MKRRLIIQMGIGIGETAGQAAERAVADAQARARVHVDADVEVRVTIGVPEAVELEASGLNRAFGAAEVDVHVVPGGMVVPQPGGGDLILAGAAIETFPLESAG